MEENKNVQVQYRLVDLKEVQFERLAKEWPTGEIQVGNQIHFQCDTEKRAIRCTANFEYKKDNVTLLLLCVQSVFDFAREGWSAMYHLEGDQWIIPAPLMQMLADVTISAARGILAVRSEEAGLPRQILPLMNPAQVLRENVRFPRKPQAPSYPPAQGAGNA